MSNVYEEQYGATFGGKHSYKDYGLYPTEKPVIAPPNVRTYMLEVPGRSGSIDLTEVLTGGVVYGDRNGTFPYKFVGDREDWDNLINRIISDLHGKRMNVMLDEQQGYYYNGRLAVGDISFENNCVYIEITGTFAPYRRGIVPYSGNDWLWDPFSFETGCAREYYKLPIDGEENITIISTGEDSVSPVFKLESGQIEIVYNNAVYPLQAGDNIFYQIVLASTDVTVTARGHGELTINYLVGD